MYIKNVDGGAVVYDSKKDCTGLKAHTDLQGISSHITPLDLLTGGFRPNRIYSFACETAAIESDLIRIFTKQDLTRTVIYTPQRRQPLAAIDFSSSDSIISSLIRIGGINATKWIIDLDAIVDPVLLKDRCDGDWLSITPEYTSYYPGEMQRKRIAAMRMVQAYCNEFGITVLNFLKKPRLGRIDNLTYFYSTFLGTVEHALPPENRHYQVTSMKNRYYNSVLSAYFDPSQF